MSLVSSCSCLCPIHWNQVLSWEWRCSWSSADRRCSNYIWVINDFIAYWGASYIRGLTVCVFLLLVNTEKELEAEILPHERQWSLYIMIVYDNADDDLFMKGARAFCSHNIAQIFQLLFSTKGVDNHTLCTSSCISFWWRLAFLRNQSAMSNPRFLKWKVTNKPIIQF